jgi:phospholipid/cholesterol/gamma-HCH transport system substrate-binding protein
MAKPLLNKAFTVGLLVAVCGMAFLVAYTFFKKGGYSDRDSYRVHAFFDDATGLSWKSRLQIAGIQVGEVDRISLQGGRARLDLRVKKEVDLRVDACVTKRFPSALLPDALLDAVPGGPQAPSLRDLPEEQREVRCVREAPSVQKLVESLQKISADVEVVSGELRDTVGGSQGSIRQIIENLARISQNLDRAVSDNVGKIDSILDNADEFSGTLREVAARDKERYHAIAVNVEQASARLVEVLASMQEIVGQGSTREDLKQSMASARSALEKLNRSLEDVQKATTMVVEGRGIAGRLIADEQLGDKFSRGIDALSGYVDRLDKLQLQVDLRSEWLLNQSGAKVYAGLRVLPRPDKYYLFEIVSDPRSASTSIVTETVTGGPVGGPTVTTRTTRQVEEEKLRFSIEFARRYGPATFRIGVIESSGGVGADLHLLDDSLQLSLNLYQFARPDVDWPRTKVWANYRFLRFFYASAGLDDVLNNFRQRSQAGEKLFVIGRDVFFGGGVTFTDEDLKILFLSLGSSLGSATSQAGK